VKINWNYIKGTLLVGLVCILVGFSNFKNQDQIISSINIQFEQGDNLFMSYEMVNKLLIQNGTTVQNQAKSLIDLSKLEKQVLSHPMVEDATAFLTVDGHLKANVKQRTPIGRIHSESGSYYLDRLGEIMPLSENYSARVPIITGVMSTENLDDLYTLLMFIRADKFLEKQIIGVRKEENGQYNLLTRMGNQEIELGKVEKLPLKFKNLKAFYNYIVADKTIENYNRINLKYNNQVVCTKK
jgi:cell division protein FtsQ